MKRSRNAAYLGYLPHHHKKAKSSRHNDQDDNEPIFDLEEDVIDVNNTFEVELNDSQDGYDDQKIVADVLKEAGETFHRIRVADFECKVSKVYKSFQFVQVVNRVVQLMNEPNLCLKHDDHVYLFRDSSFSKGQWARGMQRICNEYLLPEKAVKDIMNLIYNSWGQSSNLPIKLSRTGKERIFRQLCNETEFDDDDDNNDNNDNDSVESLSAESALPALKDYNRKVNRWFSFDQCINDCCVFVGTPTFNMFACPHCHARRYRACTRSKCKGRGNDDCDHLLDNGIAFKKLHYRMLIPLFIDLINTKYFVAALHYQNECLHGSEEKYYSDILDGDVAKEHLNSMDLNFKAWCRENEDTTLDVKPIPVSLLLMDFYDGGQLFKYRTCNFWGLFTSIINLPPTYRGKVGISTFLSAVYGGRHTKAERFLFSDLYCEELRILFEGYEYISLSGTRYFIQARLIFHSMDTKALEPAFCMQSMTNSRYGCPYCRNCHGQHNSWKTFFSGNRNFLPMDSYLRYFGQSGTCCPAGFYEPESKQWFVDEGFLSDSQPITAESLMDKATSSRSKKRKDREDFCEPCDKDETRAEWIKEFLQGSAKYFWSHQDSGFTFDDVMRLKLREWIFYRHFDLRPQVKYRRITKDEHLKAACEARDLNVKKRAVKMKVHGFTDVWSFERLPYSDFARNSSPPPEHAIEGVVKRCFEYMFGFYTEKAPSKRIYKKKKKKKKEEEEEEEEQVQEQKTYVPLYRPSYHSGNDTDSRPPYSCSSDQYNMCRAWLKCARIPTTIADRSDWVVDLELRNLFKMSQWKIFISVYWSFCVSILSTVTQQYRWFFRMVGNDICKLLSFSVSKDSIDNLQLDIIEMISLWESFFQPSENFFQLHQIMHLVSSIPLFGALHSWSELFGEQALGKLKKIKKVTNSGGQSYERYIMEKHVDRELDILGRFYSSAVNDTKKTAANYKTKVSFDCEKGQLKFKVMQFNIFDPENASSNVPFPDAEIDHLVAILLMEIRKRYKGNENECSRCSILYHVISAMSSNSSPYSHLSFSNMLRMVVQEGYKDDAFSKEQVDFVIRLLQFKPIFYKMAWIYGLEFASRGSIYREFSPDHIAVLPWYDKRTYSSWCKFQHSDFNFKGSEDSYRYGLINAFFEINIGDSSIDGLFLASVTSHLYVRNAPNVDHVMQSESVDHDNLFVALQDIFPTRIGTIPIGVNSLAITRNCKKLEGLTYVNVFAKTEKPIYSVMLTLEPDKISRFPVDRPWTMYKRSTSSDDASSKRSWSIPSTTKMKSSGPVKREGNKIWKNTSNVVTSAQSSSYKAPEQQTSKNVVSYDDPSSIFYLADSSSSANPSTIVHLAKSSFCPTLSSTFSAGIQEKESSNEVTSAQYSSYEAPEQQTSGFSGFASSSNQRDLSQYSTNAKSIHVRKEGNKIWKESSNVVTSAQSSSYKAPEQQTSKNVVSYDDPSSIFYLADSSSSANPSTIVHLAKSSFCPTLSSTFSAGIQEKESSNEVTSAQYSSYKAPKSIHVRKEGNKIWTEERTLQHSSTLKVSAQSSTNAKSANVRKEGNIISAQPQHSLSLKNLGRYAKIFSSSEPSSAKQTTVQIEEIVDLCSDSPPLPARAPTTFLPIANIVG